MSTQLTQQYVPQGAYLLADQLKGDGVALSRVLGPWRPLRRLFVGHGRNADTVLSLVTNGAAEIAVDTAERAVDLSGLLNWCGVDHLEPVTDLRPPYQENWSTQLRAS